MDDLQTTKKCSNVLENPTLAVATLIDPRFKFCFPEAYVEQAKKHLLKAALSITVLDPLVELGLPPPAAPAPVPVPEPIPSTSASDASDVASATSTSSGNTSIMNMKADISDTVADESIMTSTPISTSTSTSKRPFSETFFVAPKSAKKARFGALLTQSKPAAA